MGGLGGGKKGEKGRQLGTKDSSLAKKRVKKKPKASPATKKKAVTPIPKIPVV